MSATSTLLLGISPQISEVRRLITKVAPSDATVLVVGESGTGKELAARALHLEGPRADKPYLALDCGALSPGVLESELFGHERGSFTGAERTHAGYFERAEGGTLFLDEVAEMPPAVQVKLLRVLESRHYARVGSNRLRAADVRLVAATNRDLQEAMRRGFLRPDLYHRLNVFPLRMPPLRERREDIPTLAAHFLDQLNTQYSTRKQFPPGLLDVLLAYSWPGNVRELRNYVHRAYVMSDDDAAQTALVAPALPATPVHASCVARISVGTAMREAEREVILATLARCGGVKAQAARLLGISLKTLYNRLAER